MLLNLDQLEKQLDKEELQEDRSMAAFWVINKQFQMFIDSQFTWYYESQMTKKYFAEYTGIKVKQFRETLLQHMGNVKKSVAERTRHKRQYNSRMNERQMQSKEGKVDSSKALDASLVVTECSAIESENSNSEHAFNKLVNESSEIESGKHDTSSSSENYITHAVDADIRPTNNHVPFAEVQLNAQHNVLANEQQHTEQSEPIYDTYLLKKVDSNTTLDSTNICHRGGEIDQDAEQYQVKSPLLNVEFFKTKDMVEKEVYNELSNRFLQLEKHCISLEISIQQKEESFQSNKPCKNQDSPEFHEFFEINELKAQLQAKNSTINNLKKQIKNVHEKSNKAKVKHDIDVIETITIELEHKMAKLLKENKTLKKHYKDLYDFIKVARTKTIKQTTSLIAKNDEFKAQLQEKGFTIAASKNELRKLTGNSMNTKFAKPSILGKPVLQPLRNQSVVRQLTAFRSERPKFSKPRFASQVDVNNVLSKPVTPYYLRKVRESVFVKPNHVIAYGSSRNSSKESYGSNDMAHNYYLEEAKKKSRDKNTNLKPSVMHTTSLQNTTNGSKPKPRSNNQISKSLHVAKSSHGMLNGVTLVDHSRNSSFFSDSKYFVCSTCQKCVFIANHDDCITKFLKEVNSRAKVQSLKSRNNMKPAKRIHERWISKGYRFSPNKSSAVHEKPNTPRSCLRWKPTGRIFKTAGLRWIPTGKMFTDNTTKVDSEPLNGSNDDITNPYECDQTLNVSAGTLNLSAGLALQRQMASADNTSGPAPQRKESSGLGPQLMTPRTINSGLVQNIPSPTPAVPPTKIDWDSLFQPMFDEYFKPPPNVDHPVPEVPTPVPAASTCSRSSTTVDQDASSSSTSQTTLDEQSSAIPQGVEDDFYDIEVAHMDTDPYFGIPIPKPNSEETILQGVIPSNVHHLNQSFDTLTKLIKNHPLDNVIGDPSRPVLTRILRIILVVLPEHPSDTYVFTMKMEILLEPTSNKLMVGKLGDPDVHTLEDPTLILEILSRRFFLRLNLPDHRQVLTRSGVKMEMQIPRSSRVKFTATCSYSRLNYFITSRKNDLKLPQTLISTSSSNVGVAVDSLESLKQTHTRETAKLAALTYAITESLAGIHEKERHVAKLDLND
ncbi:hypothetical protein Tco_0053711 [Tanacetum coccineum]